MEEAVLGPAEEGIAQRAHQRGHRSPRGDDDECSTDSAQSNDEDEDGGDDDDEASSGSRSSSSSTSRSEEEKKKDSASNTPNTSSNKNMSLSSTANLTLAQRSQLQRAMQVQFLKEQGLISKETDVKGGASLSGGTNTPSPGFHRLGSGASSNSNNGAAHRKGPIRLNSGMSDSSSRCSSTVGR
jgi:hypothetical protein